jgi:succinate dehydrogenase/fumarate reductase cytochrome b subunit
MFEGFFGVLLFVADVYAVLKIMKSSAGDGKKALWIAIVVLLPVFGVIIWYLIGPGRS